MRRMVEKDNDLILVAGPYSFVEGDIEGQCQNCKRTVFYRPHAPYKTAAAILCIECTARLVREEA